MGVNIIIYHKKSGGCETENLIDFQINKALKMAN